MSDIHVRYLRYTSDGLGFEVHNMMIRTQLFYDTPSVPTQPDSPIVLHVRPGLQSLATHLKSWYTCPDQL